MEKIFLFKLSRQNFTTFNIVAVSISVIFLFYYFILFYGRSAGQHQRFGRWVGLLVGGSVFGWFKWPLEAKTHNFSILLLENQMLSL